MRHLPRCARLAALFIGLIVWPCVSLVAQDNYEVRLHRPERPGDEYHRSSVVAVSEKQTVKTGGKVVESNSRFAIECDAVVTVLEVDEKAKEAKVSLAIERCMRIVGDDKTEVVPQGTVAVLSMNGAESVVTINGKPAAEGVKEALSRVMPLDPGAPTDDEVFGVRERMKVGDSWHGDSDLLAKSFLRHGSAVHKEDVTSSFTLEKIVKVEGLQCLEVNGELNLKKFQPALPPGSTLEKASLRVRLRGEIPANLSEQVIPASSVEMTIAIVFKPEIKPGEPDVVVEVNRTENVTTRQTHVSKGEAKPAKEEGLPARKAGTVRAVAAL